MSIAAISVAIVAVVIVTLHVAGRRYFIMAIPRHLRTGWCGDNERDGQHSDGKSENPH
jgi:hypothetical protein